MAGKSASKTFKGPKGTRDMYPEDMLRRRYIVQTWRDTSIRHGFEEIEGPTFEEADLYAVKSGDGILGELFQAFSGKSPEEVERVRATGRAPFAMRPEFTPTLARMYAARARQLARPTRWFMAGPFFRAERPQRGRLREFLQWNCDVLGTSEAGGDRVAESDAMLTLVGACVEFGFAAEDMRVLFCDRRFIEMQLAAAGVGPAAMPGAFALLDKRHKISADAFADEADALGFSAEAFDRLVAQRDASVSPVADETPWLAWDSSIVRGLAYYTGLVFELSASGERAVAGGGRYDGLIELVGGPPTPAVGFAMGDVVLSLMLEEKGLMPEGADLLDAVSARPASARPEAFVIGANDEVTDGMVRRLVADLRRGVESAAWLDQGEARRPWQRSRYDGASGGVRPMHARSSDKSTRNVKKLLGDASRQLARFAVVIHDTPSTPDRVQLKDLDRALDLTPRDVPGMPSDVAEFSVQPTSPVYVGRAIAALAP
jgi:histidyl-tRNA synthetase